jgi:hypothetical protein
MSSYDHWTKAGKIDNEKYIWLTKNVNKMQEKLGGHGRMFYVAPFRTYQIPRYEIVINTLPKFKEGNIKDFDLNSVDDCLIRYIGVLEGVIDSTDKKLKNPIIWFKEGFQELVTIPIYLLNWFGLISDKNVFKITSNLLYKIISGVGGLIAFVSSAVTIIQGKEAVIELMHKILNK